MNGLFLLCCMDILGAVLCGTHETFTSSVENSTDQDDLNNSATAYPPSTAPTSTPVSSLTTQPPTTVTQSNSRTMASPSPSPGTATFDSMFLTKECLPVFMVAGGLIIASTILLVSALLLAWKVCQLSRRIKALSSNADLISNTEYWMGTAKRDKGKSETEPKETTVLMADLNQTQEEMGNGATQEEGGKVNEDGQTGEEKKPKEEEDAKEASTTPETVAEVASSSKPQEEAGDDQPTKAAAKEAKDEV